MRVDVLGLQAFVSIAERGSFSAAASHLNLSQTALSHRIKKLEDVLGTQLLQRTTRSVTLTPAGLALFPHAQKLFGELGDAINQLKSVSAAHQERVTIGCLPTIAMQCMPGIVAKFLENHPGVPVKIFDSSVNDIAERVESGDAEFGVTILAASRWDLDIRPVAKEPFVLVGHKSSPLAQMQEEGKTPGLTWAQLQGAPLIRISAETGNRILIDDALGARGEVLNWQYEVQRVTTAVSMVQSVPAYTIVPQLAFDVVEANDLVAIPLRGPTVARTLGIITRKGRPLSKHAQKLMTLTTQTLKRRFAQSENAAIDS